MTDPDLSDLPGLSDFSALPGFRGSVGVSPSLAELADLAALPKAEIHVHLEGTVSARTGCPRGASPAANGWRSRGKNRGSHFGR